MTTSKSTTPILKPSILSFVEIQGLRSNFGHNEDAINRHSVRYYVVHVNGQDVGQAIYIDRNQDTLPKSFTVTEIGYWSSKGINIGCQSNKGKSEAFPKALTSDIIASCSTWMEIEKQLTHIVSLTTDFLASDLGDSDKIILERSTIAQDNFHLVGKAA